MPMEAAELDAFYRFAQDKIRSERSTLTLEDVLREFRQIESWTPRTPLGNQLKQLRAEFIAQGGSLLSPEEIAAEVCERRGTLISEVEE